MIGSTSARLTAWFYQAQSTGIVGARGHGKLQIEAMRYVMADWRLEIGELRMAGLTPVLHKC